LIPGRARDFLFFKMSRPALGPTQPPIQWVLGILSLSMKQLGCGVDHSAPSNAKVKNEWMELYLYSPFVASWHVQEELNLLLSTVEFF
jgi:hypothetical protein